MNKAAGLIKVLLLLFLTVGCSAEAGAEETEKPEAAAPEERYEVPEFAVSEFHEEAAEYKNGAYIDISNAAKGYVAVSAVSDKRLKFQVLTEETYNYNISSDGEVSIFPLQSGDTEYTFRVMENISENKYAVLFQTSADVKLEDEFQPFLRSSDYAFYTRESECVKLADSFSASSSTALDVVAKVYAYVCDHIKYDRPKAENIKSGYLPDPDETLDTGKGICFDYASLTAAMLRSQGIPTKVIFGYVSPNDVYHAWNMFYTKESGWVSVKFEVNEKEWTRMDLTFSANGSDQKFIGDGSNYADVYEY
ncbi:MAG: transglutaminase domain-containing protein [Erysipelotrichaceae bacterium]|nr:transglutaminase domain-containing protein [Erysipelotrichaceae bacterium]